MKKHYYLKPEWKEFVAKQSKGYFPVVSGTVIVTRLYDANNTWREYAEVFDGKNYADIPCRFLTTFNYEVEQS